MTNFDVFAREEQFAAFAPAAVSAEKILNHRPGGLYTQLPPCHGAGRQMDVLRGRQDLEMPYRGQAGGAFWTAEDFRDIVGRDLWKRLQLHPPDRQRLPPTLPRKLSSGAGPAVSGKPLCVPGLHSLLLWGELQRRAVRPRLCCEPAGAPGRPRPGDLGGGACRPYGGERPAPGRAHCPARRSSRTAMCPSPWSCPSTRPASSTSTPCSPTPAGQRARTGSTRWSCPGCPTSRELGYADYVLYGDDRPAAGRDRGKAHLRGCGRGPPAGQAVCRHPGKAARPPPGDFPHQRL